jgi:hypothetical protein
MQFREIGRQLVGRWLWLVCLGLSLCCAIITIALPQLPDQAIGAPAACVRQHAIDAHVNAPSGEAGRRAGLPRARAARQTGAALDLEGD